MTSPILYLGDTCLSGAAAYLAGLMTSMGWQFEYVASHEKPSAMQLVQPKKLFIFSDYPAQLLDDMAQQSILSQVAQGAGLLMIGGWESFHGLGGNWDQSAVGRALPVNISAVDDRINFDQPTLLQACQEHPILSNLPWTTRPPGIGGLNRVEPRPQTEVLLEAQSFDVQQRAEEFLFFPTKKYPALVVGQYQTGHTAALATDVAPHWVGGLVDWGPSRVTAQAVGASEIEVGSYYAQFFQALVRWTGKL